MSDTQSSDGAYKLVNTDTGTESNGTFSTEAAAKGEARSLFDDDELEHIEVREVEDSDEQSQDGGENSDQPTPAVVEPDTVETQQQPDTGDTEALPQQEIENVPKISPIEDQTRSVIESLTHEDMNRLVWDPDANPKDVPYNPKYLPYDRPEPSAEAFDMFSTIIEGVQDVQYSVVDVEFEKGEDTLACSVIVEKQTPNGTKQLPGFKTRKRDSGPGLDHWRERLYSKARRNALKQDIPPTWISALMAQYRGLENE